ncbi:MAG: transposase [Lachnospiraceae bacterium]|nr:transposase [Lachnospiraceae bacterium]
MAEKDIAEKNFMALEDVFADVYNGLLFNGEEVIKPDDLEDVRGFSQYKADDSKLHEQERDVLKLWKGHGINLAFMGIENQTNPNRDMPFRVIGYDGAKYRSQLLEKETKCVDDEEKQVYKKERYPVVTVVLYMGKDKWNYSNNLIDCFNPKLPDDDITSVMKEYISDYKINVFDIGDMSLEDIEVFKSDFKMIAEHFVRLRNNEQDYEPDNRSIQHVDEFLKLMSVLTGDTEFLEQKNAYSAEEKEGGKVAMDRIMEYRYNKGVVEGETRGEDLITSLIKKLKENNRINELDRVLNEPEYRKELYKEYGIK